MGLMNGGAGPEGSLADSGPGVFATAPQVLVQSWHVGAALFLPPKALPLSECPLPRPWCFNIPHPPLSLGDPPAHGTSVDGLRAHSVSLPHTHPSVCCFCI